MSDLQTAKVTRKRGSFLIWLIPLVAIGAAGWLMYQAFHEAGTTISIRFAQGYGLKPEDTIRFRGIIIGVVEEVKLSPSYDGVEVKARLEPSASGIARDGCKFWIVRPQFGIGQASGLETVIGSKYISILPGSPNAPVRRVFDGLTNPPLLTSMDPHGLELMLTTSNAGGLKPGAPVSYRQVEVGKVISMGLTKNASEVETRIYIDPSYTRLIRENTVFWKFSGASLKAGIFSGIEFDVESMQSLLLGGVAFATPPNPAGQVQNQHVFGLVEKPEAEWLTWQSNIPLRDQAQGEARPVPMQATLLWAEDKLIGQKERERSGWVTPFAEYLVGPANLLCPPEEDQTNGYELVVDERAHFRSLPAPTGRLLQVIKKPPDWPTSTVSRRIPKQVEDFIVLSGSSSADRLVSVDHLKDTGEAWDLDKEIEFDASWHGAPVLADSDKMWIGVLLVFDKRVTLAPLRPLSLQE